MIPAELVRLRRKVDLHFGAAMERSRGAMSCRSGCDSCCQRRFGVFEVEAAPIRARLEQIEVSDPALRAEIRAAGLDQDSTTCALLVGGICSVYEERPIICRSHGLPILVDGGTTWCPLNFSEASPAPESVLALDALNAPLSVIAEMHASGGARVLLAELAANRA